jgi:hypothetical protein
MAGTGTFFATRCTGKFRQINIGTLNIDRISFSMISRVPERSGKVFSVPALHAGEVKDAFTLV